jgi:hypothetical protein
MTGAHPLGTVWGRGGPYCSTGPVWSGSTLMLQDYISGFSMGHANPTMVEVYLTLLHATPFGGWTFPRKTSEPSVSARPGPRVRPC